MSRSLAVGLALLIALPAFSQTADMIREITELSGPILRPNGLGGGAVPMRLMQAAALQPLPAPPQALPGRPGRPPANQPPGAPNPPVVRRLSRSVVVPIGPPKQDAYGDPLPPGAITRYGCARLRHGSEPAGLGFSPDGKMLGSLASTEDGLRLWDPVSGKELHRFNGPVMLAAFARNGSLLIVDETRCKVWTPASDNNRDLPEKTLTETPQAVAVHPDCRSFFASVAKKVLRIDLLTGKPLGELNCPGPGEQPAVRLTVSPDGRWLAGSAQRMGVWLWDLRTGKRVRTYHSDFDFPEFAFSQDGTRLAIAAERLTIFSTDSEEPLEGFGAPDGNYLNPRFSSDGKWVFGITVEGACYRIDARTGETKEYGTAPDGGVRPPAAISPDAVYTAAIDADGGIRIWDPKTGKGPEVERLPALEGPGFRRDGKTIVCLAEDGKIHAFDAVTGKRGETIELPIDDDSIISWNPRTRQVIVIVPTDQGENELRVVDVDSKKVLHKVKLPLDASASQIAFAAKERSRMAVFGVGTVCVVNVSTGRVVRTLTAGKIDEMQPLRGDLSPDGRLLAVGSRPLSLWEVATGKKRFDLEALSQPMGAGFSPDGRYLAAWDSAAQVVVFDVRTGAVVRRLQANAAEYQSLAAAFSPDGKRLAAGDQDGGVTVWDVTTGGVQLSLDRHDAMVTGLAFSSDGARLASTSLDGTVLVWDVAAKAAANPADAAVAGLEDAFRLLGSSEAASAQRGLEFLYRRPAEAVKMCADRIAIPAATPQAAIIRLVADLESEDFPVRQAAVKDLQAIGGEAVSALRTVIEKSGNAEARKLAGEVAAHIEGATPRPEELRVVRAVELLENLDSPEARVLLTKWATGPIGHRISREAAAAVARMKEKE